MEFAVAEGSLSKQPNQESQDEADKQAGDQREVEAEVALGVVDVAGKPAEPAFPNPGPQDQADGDSDQAGDNEKFAQFVHPIESIGCDLTLFKPVGLPERRKLR
jgi:hypothetical protein